MEDLRSGRKRKIKSRTRYRIFMSVVWTVMLGAVFCAVGSYYWWHWPKWVEWILYGLFALTASGGSGLFDTYDQDLKRRGESDPDKEDR
jgi:fatty acid desaturase